MDSDHSEEPLELNHISGQIDLAHVVFIDIVSFSLQPIDHQKEIIQQLQDIVRALPEFQRAAAADRLLSLPTGDGMALAFFGDPTLPLRVARQLAVELKRNPRFSVRMGIHTGPIYRMADINANRNIAGGGINFAQRVMDCADGGHILISKTVADVLLQFSNWKDMIHDLGEHQVKHGAKIHIFNVFTEEFGNSQTPSKLASKIAQPVTASGISAPSGPGLTEQARPSFPLSNSLMLGAAAALLAAGAGTLWLARLSQPASVQPSIAVLPFQDMSPEKNQEYFSDGLAEELRDGLAKTPGLRVAGRTSSFQFKGKTEDSRTIGKKLNVTTILEGGVRKEGNVARISVQLVKAADGFNIWSDTFDRQMNDILAVEQEIARSVTGALKIKLLGEKTGVPPGHSTNVEAYDAELMGRYFLRGARNKENLEKAVGYFEEAIKFDPRYAPAWVGLGESRVVQADLVYIPEDGYKKAREAIERALMIDARLGEGYAVMGRIQQSHDWDWSGAEASLQRAVELEPGNAVAIGANGSLAWVLGNLDKSIALYSQATDNDPLNSNLYFYYGLVLNCAGRQEEAATALKKVLELAPERGATHGLLARVYLAQSRRQEALAEAMKENHPVYGPWALALAYHALGQKKESEANLDGLVAKFHAEAPYAIAGVYAFQGETDEAFKWLERAYIARDAGLIEMKTDPLLDKLRSDPRYAALLQKIHLPL